MVMLSVLSPPEAGGGGAEADPGVAAASSVAPQLPFSLHDTDAVAAAAATGSLSTSATTTTPSAARPRGHEPRVDFFSLQRDFLLAYGDSVESLIQHGVFFLPGGTTSTDGVREQFIYSLAELFGIYRRLVVQEHQEVERIGTSRPFPTTLSCTSETTAKVAVFLLKAVRCLQLVVEMRHPGVKTCFVLELLKIFAKFYLWRQQRRSFNACPMLIDESVEATAAAVEAAALNTGATTAPTPVITDEDGYETVFHEHKGKHSGIVLRGHVRKQVFSYPGHDATASGKMGETDSLNEDQSDVVNDENIKGNNLVVPGRLLVAPSFPRTRPPARILLGEWLYHLRPLLVLFLQHRMARWSTTRVVSVKNRDAGVGNQHIGGNQHHHAGAAQPHPDHGTACSNSWPAWWAAVLVDLLSIQLQWQNQNTTSNNTTAAPSWEGSAADHHDRQEYGKNKHTTTSSSQEHQIINLQQLELKRRRSLLLYALIRSPFFEKFFPAERLQKMWERIPVVGKHFNLVQLLLLWRPYYFYTSGT
ncbi:unnamed protein product [Amoebophrya sp. A120]|nr:unnamed protein product [Amoebophrya sp. A120]|eukprot:GSA120T00023807001.1